MTSRERVQRTLTFQSPDRIPRDLWALPAVEMTQPEDLEEVIRRFPLDIAKPSFSPGQSKRSSGNSAEIGVYTDDWGSVWQVAERGVIGEVKEPALAEWSKLACYNPPWELIRERDLGMVDAECEKCDRFMLSDCTARPFERMQFLRGTENLLMDLAYLPSELWALREMVHEFYTEDIAQWCKTSVDGVVMMDDWGAQHSLLISPDEWRSVFMPLYRDYCDLIHDAGKFAFFHTDGHVEAIYGDLIDVGVDAINTQLFCMDIEEIGRRYKGKVTFWGEIDRQEVLPFGAQEDVREAVRRVHRALGDPSGGIIAQCEWGKNNPAGNIAAVFETWDELSSGGGVVWE